MEYEFHNIIIYMQKYIVDLRLQISLQEDQFWTKPGGPYLITGPVVVQSNNKLSLDAGTEVYFSGSDAELIIEGSNQFQQDNECSFWLLPG